MECGYDSFILFMKNKIAYSELQLATNFSFLRGASHPHEYAWKAAELGYKAFGITLSPVL